VFYIGIKQSILSHPRGNFFNVLIFQNFGGQNVYPEQFHTHFFGRLLKVNLERWSMLQACQCWRGI